MPQKFTAAQRALLNIRYLSTADRTSFATSTQGVKAETALQPGEAATPPQGNLAETALQPSSNIQNNINGVPAVTLTSEAANGQTAFGWGNHALAGYLTQAPTLKLYQPGTVSGGAPETFTIPTTPYAGSEIIVAVNSLIKQKVTSDPPGIGNFYCSGTTVKTNTGAGDQVSIYYSAI